MNLEIGTEAAQLPEKEYINGICVPLYLLLHLCTIRAYRSFVTILRYNSHSLTTALLATATLIDAAFYHISEMISTVM